MPQKEGHLLVNGYNFKKQTLNIPFEHAEVINYTLDGVSIYPLSTKMQASFLTQLQERKETAQGFHHHHLKQLKSLMAVIREN